MPVAMRCNSFYNQCMQITQQPSDPEEILLRENNITITGTRLEIDNKTYALHYISTVVLDESHPPRGEALFVIAVAVLAVVMSVIYVATGKLTMLGFLIFALLSICAFIIGILVYSLDPSKYSLKLNMFNGEEVNINSKSESFIQRVHHALNHSLALSRQSVAVQNTANAVTAQPAPSANLPTSSPNVHSTVDR